jgi:hypothetical protein
LCPEDKKPSTQIRISRQVARGSDFLHTMARFRRQNYLARRLKTMKEKNPILMKLKTNTPAWLNWYNSCTGGQKKRDMGHNATPTPYALVAYLLRFYIEA